LGAWKVLRRGGIRRQRSREWERIERTLTIAAYRLGPVGPDTLRLLAVDPGGDSLRLAYAPGPLTVVGTLAADQPADLSSLRDIRDVVSTGPPTWPVLAAGALLLLAGLILFARRMRERRQRGLPVLEPAGPTPEEEFESALEKLIAARLLESGLYREFYYEVSRAVRRYLERRHGLPLLESTSREVLDLLSPRILAGKEREALSEWLLEGDLVKYARMERLQAEARNYLERSKLLVKMLAGQPESASPGAVA